MRYGGATQTELCRRECVRGTSLHRLGAENTNVVMSKRGKINIGMQQR